VWAARSMEPRERLPPMVGRRTTWLLLTLLVLFRLLAFSVAALLDAAMTNFAIGQIMGVRTAL